MAYAKVPPVPTAEKLIWSAKEASSVTGIGIHRMEQLLRQPDSPFAVKKGNHICVKRKAFEQYLETVKEI